MSSRPGALANRSDDAASVRRRLYVPRQHGAWALIAVPLLAGAAAATPTPLHLVLAVAAFSGYLTVAAVQSAAGSRSPAALTPSIAIYGSVAALSSAVVIALDPIVILAAFVVVPGGVLAIALGRARRSRELVGSLVQASQALVLAPVSASLGGATDPGRVGTLTFVAGVYLFGSVLVVRSVIRERGNTEFALASVALHGVATAVALFVLAPAWVLFLLVLTIRSTAVPSVERLRARHGKRLRPVFVGLGELAVGIALVAVAFTTR